MRKTCERPGCAETAAVVFGMVPEDLLVWMEAIDPADPDSARAGLLCTRHADATGVPLGWTLDDRREQAPRLFRIPERPAAPNRPGDATARMRRPRPEDWAQALFEDASDHAHAVDRLADDVPTDTAPTETAPVETAPVETAPVGDEPSAVAADPAQPGGAPGDEPGDEGWRPLFDRSDDLGGLLHAQSPLLRRAFGVED